jgi:hypothetical protein
MANHFDIINKVRSQTRAAGRAPRRYVRKRFGVPRV